MMEDKCIVKVGRLYISDRTLIAANKFKYEVTDDIGKARYLDFSFAKEVAKQVGGKVYRIDLKEVEL